MNKKAIPKSSLVLGLLMLVTLFLGRVSIYFQGVAFTESMVAPFVVVPLVLALAICFVITAVRALIKVMKREVHISWLWAFAWVLLLTILSFQIPLPTFVDGMAATLEEKVDEQLLLKFAQDLRERGAADVSDVPGTFSPILTLSDADPAIRIADGLIYISWGGEPRGTWGVAVAVQKDVSIPADYAPPGHTRKVYDTVWVFKTR